jgi:hypothetical protein
LHAQIFRLAQVRGPFLVGDLAVRKEELGQEAVEGLPVVEPVVVALVEVRMIAEAVELTEQGVDRLRRHQQRADGVVGAEAAAIEGVVDQQRRAGREHAGEVRVIDIAAQVDGRLLRIAQVQRGELRAGDEAGISGHRHGQLDARIQRTEHDGLPSAAGEPGHGHAVRVGVRMLERRVEQVPVRQKEWREAAGAGEIKLVHAGVVVTRAVHLALHVPLVIEGQHAVAGQVDATLLDIRNRHALAFVAVQVHHHGHLPFQFQGLV